MEGCVEVHAVRKLTNPKVDVEEEVVAWRWHDKFVRRVSRRCGVYGVMCRSSWKERLDEHEAGCKGERRERSLQIERRDGVRLYLEPA